VGIEHRVEDEHAVVRTHCREVLLRAHDELPDRDLVLLLESLAQERVRLAATAFRVGREVVGLLVEHRIDLVEVDEILDVDRVALLRLDRFELLGRELDELTLLELISLDELGALDLLARTFGHATVPYATSRSLRELV